MRTIRWKLRCPPQIPAVGIESYAIGVFERADKVGYGILGKNEASVHVIAGVKEDEDVCSGQHGGQIQCAYMPAGVIRLIRGVLVLGFGGARATTGRTPLLQLASRFIAFRKGSQLLRNPILQHGKVALLKRS